MFAHHNAATAGRAASLKKLLIGSSALPAATLGLMLSFAVATGADAHDYVISPTTFTSTVATTETLSGVFSFSGSSLISVALTLSGDGGGTPGDYTVPQATNLSTTGFHAYSTGPGPIGLLGLQFLNALVGLPDPITVLYVGLACTPAPSCHQVVANFYPGPNEGASADPIPEPSSIAILGAALVLFGLRKRADRRDRWPPADWPRPT